MLLLCGGKKMARRTKIMIVCNDIDKQRDERNEELLRLAIGESK